MEEVFGKPETVVSGFRRSGIFPPDPLAPNRKKLKPVQISESNNNNEHRDVIAPPPPIQIETGFDVYQEMEDEFFCLNNQLSMLGLTLRRIPGDGNCLFRALDDQLHGNSTNHILHRKQVVEFMEQHREDFESFVENSVRKSSRKNAGK